MINQGRILISCPDRPGIVAAVSQFLFSNGANIMQSDQFTTDPEGGQYFMRIHFTLPSLAENEVAFSKEFQSIADAFDMKWELHLATERKRMAIFASREDHCLLDLLWRWRSGELAVDIPLIISNHDTLRSVVAGFDIPYYHIPVTPETKEQAEKEQLRLLKEASVDFSVLARYMQILSGTFLEKHPKPIINIHHSFLPAFKGARPYHQAYERGVKIIGATAHYVTENLDQGPIIEQDVVRVNHRENPETLKEKGRNIERIVFAHAVRLHIEDRVIVYGNKTAVFT